MGEAERKGQRMAKRIRGVALIMLAAVAAPTMSAAEFNPAGAYRESDAVAQRYPDAKLSYRTPGFAAGKQDFTSQAEMMSFLRALASRAPHMQFDDSARSQQGRELPVLLFSRDHARIGSGAKPVVLLIGQQHGNEPAGGEAALALAGRLGDGDLAPLIDAIDVIIAPRANPDGAAAFNRALANGIDLNRDHTLQRTPEARVVGGLLAFFRPNIVFDCHEFTVAGRWVDKVGGLVRVDAMIQHATTPNMSASLSRAQTELFLPAILAAFDAQKLTHDWYHTTDGSRRESPVAMGGIGPDTGRNVAGLRNAVSFLLETRGVGLGRAHFARRVGTHVVAAEAIMRLAAKDPAAVLALSRAAEMESAKATEPVIVQAKPRAEARSMTFVDPVSGVDKTVSVAWLSALQIEPVSTRPRPAGYVISAATVAIMDPLRRARIAMRPVTKAATIAGEHYRARELTAGAKEDGRGDDVGAGAIVKGVYDLEPAEIVVAPGDLFIPMDQPLAGLVAAMMEPENDSGLVANRLIPATKGERLPIARLSRAPE